MALTKTINYYVDDDGYRRRIPWDSWYNNNVFVGLSPVGVQVNDILEFDSGGVVTLNADFLDASSEDDDSKRETDITNITEQTNERTFLETYENVIGFYESDCCQTYEFLYHHKDYWG